MRFWMLSVCSAVSALFVVQITLTVNICATVIGKMEKSWKIWKKFMAWKNFLSSPGKVTEIFAQWWIFLTHYITMYVKYCTFSAPHITLAFAEKKTVRKMSPVISSKFFIWSLVIMEKSWKLIPKKVQEHGSLYILSTFFLRAHLACRFVLIGHKSCCMYRKLLCSWHPLCTMSCSASVVQYYTVPVRGHMVIWSLKKIFLCLYSLKLYCLRII